MSGPTTHSRHIVLADGARLHIASTGMGPPVVLLHGFTGSTESWDSLTASLTGYATIAVDLPGHGRSDAPTDPARYALRRFADDLVAVLDTLDLEHAAILGYSLGGRAALHVAIAHPDRVSALILESTSPGIADPVERTERATADAALAETIERQGVQAFVDRWERLPLWASQAALPHAARAGLRAQRLKNHARGLANSLRGAGAAADPALHDEIRALSMPTLLVAGGLDVKYVALGRVLERAITGARLAVVANAGHAVHLERPAVFAELVADFLDALPSVRR